MKKFLVVGASGTVGSEIAHSLREQGHAVRATTHRRENVGTREGVERVYLDVGTGEGIAQAFEGIDRAFLLAPPGYADHQKILSPLVAEAKRRGIEKVVLMSAMGANAADTPFRRVEIELEGSGLAYNIIRPNWFMQNFNTFWLAGIRDQGAIRLPAGTAKTSFIDARDIAAVAVRLLTTDDQVNRDFDLTGPAAITHDEVARVLGKALGRDVAYEDIEPDALRQGLLAAKLPADYVEFLIVILGFLEQGYAERTTTAVRDLLGREPIAFERYARDHRDAWTQAKAA
jgi:uncharacterized protein YbjT (DUF2867 family)